MTFKEILTYAYRQGFTGHAYILKCNATKYSIAPEFGKETKETKAGFLTQQQKDAVNFFIENAARLKNDYCKYPSTYRVFDASSSWLIIGDKTITFGDYLSDGKCLPDDVRYNKIILADLLQKNIVLWAPTPSEPTKPKVYTLTK